MTIAQVREYFHKAALAGRVSHAYMLESEDGASTMAMVREFVQLLECERRDACGECYSCQALLNDNHPDVKTVAGDKPGLITVNNIREQVVNDIIIRPYRSPYKIYVVPDADSMNVQAQNALLKSLEEMPSYGMVILLVRNAGKMLQTILSRSFLIRVAGDVREHDISEAGKIFLDTLARADGLSASAIAEAVRQLQGEKKGDGAEKLSGSDAHTLSSAWFRDMLVVKAQDDTDDDRLSVLLRMKDCLPAYKKLAPKYTYRQMNNILEETERLLERLNANVNYELAFELYFEAIRIAK